MFIGPLNQLHGIKKDSLHGRNCFFCEAFGTVFSHVTIQV